MPYHFSACQVRIRKDLWIPNHSPPSLRLALYLLALFPISRDPIDETKTEAGSETQKQGSKSGELNGLEEIRVKFAPYLVAPKYIENY